ncbi:MAG TPA: Hpt domain-containing protein [Leptospiraceae bacterium]|nr:Hpt domain-containing protein [Leptospiraceae bacterium]
MDKIVVQVPSDLSELIPGYLKNLSKYADQLKELISAGDLAAAGRIGHNLKGSGGGYGLDEISTIGKLIEEKAHASDASAVKEALQKLNDYDYLSRLHVEFS